MQHYVVHRTLFDGLLKCALVALTMVLKREFVEIVLERYNLSLHAAHFRTGFVARAPVTYDKTAPQRI